MFKTRLHTLRFLLVACIFIAACSANAQKETLKPTRLEPSATTQSKEKLVREVLIELEIAQQYDLYLNSSIDMAIPASKGTDRWREWLQGVVKEEAGWEYIEDQYISQLKSDFSADELAELVNLAKHPLMKKLLQTNMKAYMNAAPKRRKLLGKVWSDYNSGKISPPPGVRPGS